jgi:hypothetical protein
MLTLHLLEEQVNKTIQLSMYKWNTLSGIGLRIVLLRSYTRLHAARRRIWQR